MKYSIEFLPKELINLLKLELKLIGMYQDKNKQQVWTYEFKDSSRIHIAETYFFIEELPF